VLFFFPVQDPPCMKTCQLVPSVTKANLLHTFFFLSAAHHEVFLSGFCPPTHYAHSVLVRSTSYASFDPPAALLLFPPGQKNKLSLSFLDKRNRWLFRFRPPIRSAAATLPGELLFHWSREMMILRPPIPIGRDSERSGSFFFKKLEGASVLAPCLCAGRKPRSTPIAQLLSCYSHYSP